MCLNNIISNDFALLGCVYNPSLFVNKEQITNTYKFAKRAHFANYYAEQYVSDTPWLFKYVRTRKFYITI